MKITNNIGWCDATINAVTGCDKVSPGCKNCYAEAGTRARVLRAQGQETWGPKGERVPVNFEPVFRRMNGLCICNNCHMAYSFGMIKKGFFCKDCTYKFGLLRRIRLFADSNSDWLDPKWPADTLARFLDAIRLAPNVDVLLLTKRIENFGPQFDTLRRLNQKYHSEENRVWIDRWYNEEPPQNVWLGVSVEDQKRADERIPLLLKTPAAVRFLSVEPLLEAIQLEALRLPRNHRMIDRPALPGFVGIDWVIVGGESGKNRRDCGAAEIESVAEHCGAAGVPCFVKQDSALLPGQRGRLNGAAWARKEFPR